MSSEPVLEKAVAPSAVAVDRGREMQGGEVRADIQETNTAPAPPQSKTCLGCGKEFTRREGPNSANWTRQKYCSKKCQRSQGKKKWNASPIRREKHREKTRQFYYRNKSTETSRLSEMHHQRLSRDGPQSSWLAPPITIGPEFRIMSKNILVTSDWHIPFVQRETYELFLSVAEKERVKDLIIGGDFWDLDDISSFANDKNVALAKEVEYVKHYLDELEKRFSRIWIVSGNHERRWSRWIQGKLDIHYLYNLTGLPLEEVNITSRDYLVINDAFRVCHSKNYSKTPCDIAKRLARKYQMNILNAHGHFCEESYIYENEYVRDKRYYVADIGGFFDKEQISYMQATSTYPDLDNGFALVQDNEPQLFRLKDFAEGNI